MDSIPTITSLAFAPDSKRLASSASDGSLLISDIDAKMTILELSAKERVAHLSFNPDGKILAAASGRVIFLVNAESGSVLDTILHPGSIEFLEFHGAETIISVSDGEHGVVKINGGPLNGFLEFGTYEHGLLFVNSVSLFDSDNNGVAVAGGSEVVLLFRTGIRGDGRVVLVSDGIDASIDSGTAVISSAVNRDRLIFGSIDGVVRVNDLRQVVEPEKIPSISDSEIPPELIELTESGEGASTQQLKGDSGLAPVDANMEAEVNAAIVAFCDWMSPDTQAVQPSIWLCIPFVESYTVSNKLLASGLLASFLIDIGAKNPLFAERLKACKRPTIAPEMRIIY